MRGLLTQQRALAGLWPFAVAICLCPGPAALSAEGVSVVAHWPLDDKDSTVARDLGPHGFDARMVGEVAWVEDPGGIALRLAGEGQHLVAPAEMPLFGGPGGATVMLWFRPEGEPQGGLLGCTTGNTYPHGRLTLAYKKDAGDRFIQNLANGEAYDHVKLYPIPRSGYWNHCAVTCDGSAVCTYINGALVRRQDLSFAPDTGGAPLHIGRTGQWLGGPATFRGLLRDVRVFAGALSPEQVRAYLLDTAAPLGYSLTAPTVQVEPDPASGRAVVSVEVGLLPDAEPETSFAVEVLRPGETAAVATGLTTPLRNPRTTEAVIDLQAVEPGPLRFTARALGPDGEPEGETGATDLAWPERRGRFSPADGVRILNNMVFELLNEETVAGREHSFRNPRDGWVYLAAPRADGQSEQTGLELDGRGLALDPVGGHLETMRHLPRGEHRLRLVGAHGPQRVIARSIGGLYYMLYGAEGHVERAAGITGAHDWDFLQRHVLDHTNTVVALSRVFGDPSEEERLRRWHDRGRRWQEYFHVPGESVLETLRGKAALRHPLCSGGWVDELGMRHRPVFGEWAQALEAIARDPQTADRTLCLYFMGLNSAMGPLVSATCKSSHRIGIEWYLRPYPTEADMEAGFRPHEQRAWQRQWFERVGGGEDDCREIALGLASQGIFSLDMYPHVDFRVFYDRQFQFVATEPAFFGIRGIHGWWSTHASEEMIRLQARLMRHYFIEGRTDRFLPDPYILTHLRNPDFAEGTAGWDLDPADPPTAEDPGSIQATTAPLFGQLQGRAVTYYVGHQLQASRAPLDLGDTVLWTRRSERAPNRFAQTIRDLVPGRLYSLRWFTADYQDLVRERSDGRPPQIGLRLDDAQMVDDPELCYDYVEPAIPGWSKARIGAFDRDKPYYVSGHHRVFRAQAATARLTLSDWEGPEAPGGPIGQELIWNFICVRPYLPPD